MTFSPRGWSMRRFLLLAGVPALLPLFLGAQAPTGAFLTRLGRDTVAFERYTVAKDRLEGDLVVTTPRTRILHYVVSLRPDGSVSKAELASRPAVEGPGVQPAANLTAEFAPEAILVHRADRVDTVKVPAGGGPVVLPNLFYSWALAELATGQAARQARDSVPLFQFALTGRQPTLTFVVRRGRDSVALDFFGSPLMFRVERAGRILGVNGGRTTVKVLAERLADVDLAKLTESFAVRERSGQVVGQRSARDTVRAVVGGLDCL